MSSFLWDYTGSIPLLLRGSTLNVCRRSTMWEVVVDKDKCNGSEECISACPASVYELVDGKADPVNMDECIGCETCVEVCPNAAITVTEV
jgi:NAD-dependent dihydropyrimidine dehydrogenase PreA subunit